MSYINDIKTVFETVFPNGTFMFASEVRADDQARNMDAAAFPLMVVDDSIQTTTVINQNASGTDSPRIKFYMLTALDLSNERVVENNQNRFYQHEQCITPMKDAAIRVMSKYFQGSYPVSRQAGIKPTMNITDEYSAFSKMLYGVSMSPTNLTLSRVINYCDTP